MKKSWLYTSFLFFSLCAGTGCKKELLEQNSPDKLTSDNFWTNKERALTGLAAAYSQLESFVDWDNYVEARSCRDFYREDFAQPGTDAYNYAWWMQIYNFNYDASNYAIELLWRDNYRGINFSNQVLENVSIMTPAQIDDSSKNAILAEAHFLRAYYNFKLLTNFEKVIIRDKVPQQETDLPKAPATRAEVWDFILADLRAAEPVLPLRSKRPASELGRITKGAAQAYLGKALMYRAGEEKANSKALFTEAAAWLEKVILSNEYGLVENYLGLFDGSTSNSKESVFELQQTMDQSNGAYFKSQLSDWVAAYELGGYGEIYGTPRLVTEMKKEGEVATDKRYDHRLYNTIFFKDPYFNEATNPRVYGKVFDSVFKNNKNAIAFRKWIPAKLNQLGNAVAINVPLMRLADVKLLYAEAQNEAGEPGKAVTQINEVRARAGMPALALSGKQAIFDQLIHERVMEFTLEGSRFYDLRRWGLLVQQMQAAKRQFSADKSFYPLPQKETLNNPLAQ
ncbi:RagB/SusD family nutrient uptake outer membrane protein [Chitinophaga nivalis]|uniref:RagB/SusD family nutrient uptake outer membrane protein n=1 Tax=Chitinophaga nivalis TaxID=2991709 RepID=A0ABT3IPL2_9BACT|nr:RagB/SusD family nutrient uptake outer membrane protein [Chitinophaga nivalis]MCW3464645.1 RagB/SusD family nutrient uptake outer membrane protein [Chitinophaga nivalis]MCW3485664.1 RagB/SusD family nutrient uptake outer membrane protein [Chitinophaga nivalis]